MDLAETRIRTEMLLGKDAMERLLRARVAVFGLGGVGGCAVEALARSGVGTLVLTDNDTIAPSNLNRQIIATAETVGRAKTDVCAERVKSVAPACRVEAHKTFFLPETKNAFDFKSYDYVVDAIDTVTGKLALIECAREAGVPVISSMGAGNKLDPTAFRVSDIYQTSVCPLARTMRQECKKRGIDSLKVVWSAEPPLRPLFQPKDPSPRRDTPGSVAFVPAVAGYILAGEVVKDLIRGIS